MGRDGAHEAAFDDGDRVACACSRTRPAATESQPPRYRLHLDFAHEALAESLANPLVTEIYERNRERIRIMQNSRPLLPDRIIPAMEEHLVILDAISALQPEVAAQAVRDHCRQTLRWWGILT